MAEADENIAQVIERADKAMYQAKASGRNQVILS
ncbi:MAG: diguanylate cyclase domain-containing protein [Methylophilaceae bacterium]